ncbi:hypothetical protein GFY24_33060 [Nocardia sp. SYP-A9097]|uniref:hypothetical protein n=1 Tax=Nocardia sp. SYP-A9097 TaxID=2663237 RepID=UPI00129A5470|nr:hypothetical protein [Nocardia sp. SYP-A9097]MRH92210.1 hypothetical protein [Nocardia sp. SYP-A9097]
MASQYEFIFERIGWVEPELHIDGPSIKALLQESLDEDMLYFRAISPDTASLLQWLYNGDTPQGRCQRCLKRLETRLPGQRGRQRIYCNPACRQRAYRERRPETEVPDAEKQQS